ncbi:MAG TPA: protein phosphatase 2C domain-containing protein [Bryobacteraceae bacterium]
MPVTSHGCSDIGCVRTENEDRILFDDALGLYVVCDGIGGRRRGDMAAEIATNTIRDYIESSINPREVTWPYGYALQKSFAGNRLLTAVKMANRQVFRRGEESLQSLGMGTTVTAVLVDGSTAAVANIGDSRVYLLRGGRLEQLSVDDTVSMGLHAPDGTSQVRSVLTRAAGSEQNVDVHLKELELSDRDTLLLCSDGLYGYVPEEPIAVLLASAPTIRQGAEALIAAARTEGAPDNASAVLLEYRIG